MEIFEAIAKRQSVRSYRPDPVPEEILRQILAAAHQAPSSFNLQPWEYIVVTDPEQRKLLRVAANGQAHVEQAGATIICLGSMRQQDAVADRLEAALPPDATPERIESTMRTVNRHRHDEAVRQRHVATNTFIATAFLVLAAQEFGLGTIWMGGFDPTKVRELFAIPDHYEVISLVSLGYPTEDWQPKPRQRRPLDEIIHWGGIGQVKASVQA
jgi:nitroreductase